MTREEYAERCCSDWFPDIPDDDEGGAIIDDERAED